MPASSKLAWVRVEFSKNMLIWVMPASASRALHGAAVDLDIGVGEVEEGANLIRGQMFDAKQMSGAECHGGPFRIFPLIESARAPDKA